MSHHGIKTLYEPFCGGCWVTTKATFFFDKIYASDIHADLVMLWKALQNGWVPDYSDITELEYTNYKYARFASPQRAFIGFAASFGGEWFHTFALRNNYDYLGAAYKSCLDKMERMQEKVTFNCCCYSKVQPVDAVVYCDPPYANTRNYKTEGIVFDKMWQTFIEWSKNNHVYVSEYDVPLKFRPNIEVVDEYLHHVRGSQNKNLGQVREYLLKVKP